MAAMPCQFPAMPCHATSWLPPCPNQNGAPCRTMLRHAAHYMPRAPCLPAGRGGSCELMIGCIAKAASSELTVDEEEMSEVRWVSQEGAPWF